MRSRLPVVVAVIVLASALAGTPVERAHAEGRRPGETTVFARVPDPGQPQGILVDGDAVHVSGAAVLTDPTEDWLIWTFDRDSGAVTATQRIPRSQAAAPAMGLAGMARDAQGRLYVVDMNGRILRTAGPRGTWEVYATFPTSHAHIWPAGTMPFDITFDATGNAYVIDFNFPGIWRIRPGGGQAEQWFTDPRLASFPFGGAGIRIGPDDDTVYFALTFSEQPGSPGQGIVYSLPIDRPEPARLREVFRYPPGTSAGGLAFGKSGKLYVVLQASGQVSILDVGGTEELRFPSRDENQKQEIPYDIPQFAAFDGNGSLLVTNWAAGNSDHWAVLSTFVDDTALPLAEPSLP